MGQARTAFPARQSPKALCPSMTRAPVSHRSREGIPGSDRAKLPQQTATGGHSPPLTLEDSPQPDKNEAAFSTEGQDGLPESQQGLTHPLEN